MATKLFVQSGRFIGVYDNRFRALYRALGIVTSERASDVEMDNVTGEWVAIEKATGLEIARGEDRDAVIAEEVRYLETQLCSGERKASEQPGVRAMLAAVPSREPQAKSPVVAVGFDQPAPLQSDCRK